MPNLVWIDLISHSFFQLFHEKTRHDQKYCTVIAQITCEVYRKRAFLSYKIRTWVTYQRHLSNELLIIIIKWDRSYFTTKKKEKLQLPHKKGTYCNSRCKRWVCTSTHTLTMKLNELRMGGGPKKLCWQERNSFKSFYLVAEYHQIKSLFYTFPPPTTTWKQSK